MSASEGRTSGIQTTLYVDTDFLYNGANPTYANLTTANTGLIIAANLVAFVTDIGAQEQTGNTIEYTCYGEKTSRRVAGVASQSEFTFSVALDNSNATHTRLVALGSGDKIQIGVKTETAADEITVDYLEGTVSSISKSTPIDDVQTLTISVALSKAPARVNQS